MKSDGKVTGIVQTHAATVVKLFPPWPSAVHPRAVLRRVDMRSVVFLVEQTGETVPPEGWQTVGGGLVLLAGN